MNIVVSYNKKIRSACAARYYALPSLILAVAVCTVPFLSRLTAAQSSNPAGSSNGERVPVLLELFTSEGCSSCPPADRLLEKVDRQQPIKGATLIVVSEHVDYWNSGGWTDPFSSKFFSKRQEEYAARLETDVYTPQLVVNGEHGGVGGDWNDAQEAVREAIGRGTIPISLNAERTGSKADIHVQIGGSRQSSNANVILVLASNHVSSNVGGGENAGRQLGHTAVAYSVEAVGTLSNSSPFEKSLQVSVKPDSRVIVFIQEPHTGRILGVAQVHA